MNNRLLLTAILGGFVLGLAAVLVVRITTSDPAVTPPPLRLQAVEAQSDEPQAHPTVDVNGIIMDIRPGENIRITGGIVMDPEPAAQRGQASQDASDSGIGTFPSKRGDRYVHFEDGTYVQLPDDVRLFRVSSPVWSHCDAPPRAPEPCPPRPVYTLKRGEAEITVDAAGNRFDWGNEADDPSQFTFLETDRTE